MMMMMMIIIDTKINIIINLLHVVISKISVGNSVVCSDVLMFGVNTTSDILKLL